MIDVAGRWRRCTGFGNKQLAAGIAVCLIKKSKGRLKSREWTTWHEVARVDNAGVSDHEREKFYDFPIHYMFKIVACLIFHLT